MKPKEYKAINKTNTIKQVKNRMKTFGKIRTKLSWNGNNIRQMGCYSLRTLKLNESSWLWGEFLEGIAEIEGGDNIVFYSRERNVIAQLVNKSVRIFTVKSLSFFLRAKWN